MNLIVSSIESERETIVREAVDLFLEFSSKLPDPVVVLSDGKFSMDNRVKILCPFIGDLLCSALDEPSTIIIPDFHSRTFDCIGSILVQGYGEYYSHDVKEVVELGKALNIGGINSLLVSKGLNVTDHEKGSICTDNETKKNEFVARTKMNMLETQASELKDDLKKLSVENLIESNIVTDVNEYYEDNKMVKYENKANTQNINSPLVSKAANGIDVDDDREEGVVVKDEEETMEKDFVSRIEVAEFSKVFRDVPNILKRFKCKYCGKIFSSLISLNWHFTAKHSPHVPNITTNYEENFPLVCVYCNKSYLKMKGLNYHIIKKHTQKVLRRSQKRNLFRDDEIVVPNTDPKRITSSFDLREQGRINRQRKPAKLKPMDNLSGPFTETVESLIVDKGDDRNTVVGVNRYYVLHKKKVSTRNIDLSLQNDQNKKAEKSKKQKFDIIKEGCWGEEEKFGMVALEGLQPYRPLPQRTGGRRRSGNGRPGQL